jgi:uncharacterized protein DUF4440
MALVLSPCSSVFSVVKFLMRLSAILVLGLLLGGCAGPPRHATWNNATGGEQYERLMWKAIREKDWDNVERHLSPTFIGVNPEGQMLDRSGWIVYWKSAQPVEFSQGELVVQPEGADMKVSSIVQLQSGGQASAGSGLRVVSIWQPIKNRWALTAISLTPIQNK